MATQTALTMLLQHNLWANQRLIDLCAGLTDEQFDAGAPGTYGTVRDTLAHIVGAECRYAAALAGAALPDLLAPGDAFTGFDTLRDLARWSGETLIGAASEVDRAGHTSVDGLWHDEPFDLPAVHFVIQAINHATEHRAQIKMILTQQGIEPPELDGWEYLPILTAG